MTRKEECDMQIRRHRRPEVPMLNTASLPDLIFTVLFFFMMVTHMRNVTPKVQYHVPEGKELTRLSKKNIIYYIYIGEPTQPANAPRQEHKTLIQLNNKYVTPADITDYMTFEMASMIPSERDRVMVSIKADRSTHMRIISDVRQALRQAGVRRISLSATGVNDKLIQK